MTDLVLLEYSGATTFAYYLHEIAPVKLMCTHNDLLIRKLVAAAFVVTLEPD